MRADRIGDDLAAILSAQTFVELDALARPGVAVAIAAHRLPLVAALDLGAEELLETVGDHHALAFVFGARRPRISLP